MIEVDTSYPNAPVRLVVLSVEYSQVAATPAHVERLRAAMREEFPLTGQQTETQLTLALGSAPQAHQQVRENPVYSSRDRRTSVAVTPNKVVIETRRYDGFQWFTDLIRMPLEAVGKALVPDAVVAIGHRFIDEVHLPSSGEDLARWFDPALLALPRFPEPRPERWQAVVNYQFDPESQLTLHYGPLDSSLVPSLDGRPVAFAEPAFGLDWDSRWAPTVAPEFDVDAIVERVSAMYAPARSLFHRICSDDLRNRFETPPIGSHL